jgi:transposase-like protein
MARKVNSELREVWRNRIEAQGRSGLTVAEFCEREGVSSGTFYGWRRKLRAKRSRRTGKALPRQKSGTRPYRQEGLSGTPSQVPFVQLPVSGPPTSPWIEVVLAEGTVVRLPQQNLAALQTVLRTLSGTTPASSGGEVQYA